MTALVLFTLAALAGGAATTAHADSLYANDQFACGDNMYSSNGIYRFHCVQYANWYVLAWDYEGPGTDYNVWRSYSDGGAHGLGTHQNQWAYVANNAIAIMQGDGNFVLYNHSFTQSVWATSTYNNSNAWFNMQDDGNLVVYTAGSSPLWSIQ